jgi:hypothetical protein
MLSLHDLSKLPLLGNERVLSLLVSVLRRFQENQPEYSGMNVLSSLIYVGGGGKDTESLAKAIEALLQLSFFYAAGDDATLRTRFLIADPMMVKLLTDMLEMPPSPLDSDARGGLSALLQRLVFSPPSSSSLQAASDKGAEGMVESSSPSKSDTGDTVKKQPVKHVMLSYGE